jgi:Skp family chaperone for outer membrane proteins
MNKVTVVLVAALLLAVTMGLTVGLRAQGREFTPPRIAVLNVLKVIENYDRSRAVQESLKEGADKLRAEFEQEMRDLKTKEADLDLMGKETKAYADAVEKLEFEKFRLQYRMKQVDQKLRKEARDEMAAIYLEIQDAVARYAKTTGLDAVLATGSEELKGTSLQEVQFEIAVRPMHFHVKELDITEAILGLLNAE